MKKGNLAIKSLGNYSDLKENDSFKVLISGLNNSDCSYYYNGPHGCINDCNTTEIYKVKKIHEGGIYSTKNYPFTIETYCKCFIRFSLNDIVKID